MSDYGNPAEPIVQVRGGSVGQGEITMSALLDAAFCNLPGAILVRCENYWECLDPGTPGDVLTTNGPGLCPSWGPGGGVATPAFTAFAISGQATSIEVGTTIAAGSKTFTWATSNSTSVLANSIGIVDTTRSLTLATGLANDGTEPITITALTNILPASNVWTITGQNTSMGTFSRTFTVVWLWRVYAGTSVNPTLTANQIKALTDFSGLQASFAGTYPLSAGGYKYFCYPDSMGNAANFIDPNTGFQFSMATVADDPAYSNTANGWSYALVSVTNVNSIATNYRVYRSQYVLGGSITMRVS